MKGSGGLILLAGLGAAAWYYFSIYGGSGSALSAAIGTANSQTVFPPNTVTVSGAGTVTVNPNLGAITMNCPGDPGCPGSASAAMAQVTTGGAVDS